MGPKTYEKAGYTALPVTDQEHEHYYDHDEVQSISCKSTSTNKSRLTWQTMCLAFSVTLNLILLTTFARSSCGVLERDYGGAERSQFAGLQRNIARPWLPFDVANDTEQDILWQNTSLEPGNVALDDEYAQEMGLPRAQRFPWDSSKGLYFINGFHNMHCILRLRRSLVEFRSNLPQTEGWHHVKHCLMVLRDEIMCEASDIPRYTGYQPPLANGLGQVRMCRDWAQLERWGREHTACWKPVGHRSDPGFKELDRYRFCPPGSPYAETAKTAWLHSSDSDKQPIDTE